MTTAIANENYPTTQDGFVRARVPVDRALIKSKKLVQLIEGIEGLKVSDGRSIWELLVDAGADSETLLYRDKDDDNDTRQAALQFRVNIPNVDGFLVIEESPTEQSFVLLFQNVNSNRSVQVGRALLSTLGQQLENLVLHDQRRCTPETVRTIIR
ncbi:hypothetical protein [Herbaspirillum huttiense]|uniref:hypothetical protein n=1 Tax=Herbaspirillum huttiense TaxID=863372 RepID=UPI0039B0DEFA